MLTCVYTVIRFLFQRSVISVAGKATAGTRNNAARVKGEFSLLSLPQKRFLLTSGGLRNDLGALYIACKFVFRAVRAIRAISATRRPYAVIIRESFGESSASHCRPMALGCARTRSTALGPLTARASCWAAGGRHFPPRREKSSEHCGNCLCV